MRITRLVKWKQLRARKGYNKKLHDIGFDNEPKKDMNGYARYIKDTLRRKQEIFGEQIIYVGKAFVVTWNGRYRNTYSYLELKDLGIKAVV